ncbi:MAG: hypothetical protein ACK4OM_02235 [Alphaproteobacteria bacterium]
MKEKLFKTGFSLIELASVLTAIAFIVGIIISASAIIQTAQIRSIISEVNSYKSAVKIFEQRYGGLPGDIKASTIWSSANNGNEDSTIGTGVANTADIQAEPTYAWQHLKLANLVNYPQISSSIPFPQSKIDGAYYILYDQNTSSPLYNRIGTYLGLSGISSSLPWASAINRLLATAIDVKVDDGLPSSGMVYVARGSDMDTTCASPSTSCKCVSNYWSGATWNSFTSSSYMFNDTSNNKTCRIIFWLKEMN